MIIGIVVSLVLIVVVPLILATIIKEVMYLFETPSDKSNNYEKNE
jgi:hypothetical protein